QADPATEYYNYRLEVLKVNNTFTVGNTEGYASDRGRVYLKYGPPDQRSERPSEPDNYPYEIWQYYKLRGQTNVKFVFYMPDEGLPKYYTLHSDLRGEPKNRRWQVMLSQRSSSFTIDQVDPMDNYGNWSGDLYNNPR